MKLNKVTFNDTAVYVNGKEAGYYEKFGDTYVFYEKYSFNHNMTPFSHIQSMLGVLIMIAYMIWKTIFKL